MTNARVYKSPLREAQAAQTRERILEAARSFLEANDIDGLTLRRAAELAQVSPPTVYAHFPTLDDLMAAFFQWLSPRIGMDEPLPPLAELPGMPARLFALYEANGALLRKLMDSPSWDRRRLAGRDRRIGAWIEAIGAELPHLAADERRRGGLAVASCWSPTHWRWLTDTGGLTQADAVASASWTIRTLIQALKQGLPPEDRP